MRILFNVLLCFLFFNDVCVNATVSLDIGALVVQPDSNKVPFRIYGLSDVGQTTNIWEMYESDGGASYLTMTHDGLQTWNAIGSTIATFQSNGAAKFTFSTSGTLTLNVGGGTISASEYSGPTPSIITLKTARTFTISGAASGTSAGFNGGANLNIPVTINDDVVTTASLATNSVAAAEMVANSVTSAHLADGNVLNTNFAAGSVSSAKITNATIATADLASGSVLSAEINNGAITAAKWGTGPVTSAKIVDSAVTAAKLAANIVTSAHIIDNTMATAHFADSVVTAAKIAASAVTADRLASNCVTTDKIFDATVATADFAADTLTTADTNFNFINGVSASWGIAWPTPTLSKGSTVSIATNLGNWPSAGNSLPCYSSSCAAEGYFSHDRPYHCDSGANYNTVGGYQCASTLAICARNGAATNCLYKYVQYYNIGHNGAV